MFFDDPVAAFANITAGAAPGRAPGDDGLAAHERNEWDVAIRRSLAGPEGPVAAAAAGPDPFSLADPPTVKQILGAAGFTDIAFTDVTSRSTTVRTWPPPSTGSAASPAPARHEAAGPAAAARAVGRLRETFSAHLSDDGVWFNSRAWIITARRH
jgi:hypothetical protein